MRFLKISQISQESTCAWVSFLIKLQSSGLRPTTLLTLCKWAFLGLLTDRGRAKRPPLPKICHTYRTMMKLGTVISCLKKIQSTHQSRDTPFEFSWNQDFLPEIYKLCYTKKYRYIISNSFNFFWVFKRLL